MDRVVLIVSFIFAGIMNMAAQPVIRYQIETGKVCQAVESFSASDAWSMQFIGLWPEEKRNQVADWLFSKENDAHGQPKGIGLSLWRFNVGAGSTEQGKHSGIGSAWMRTECFLSADGTYRWEKQQGQRNFLRLAKERGVDKFLAFVNSPPVHFTQNGLATNTGRGGTFNLRPECYKEYVAFLATVIEEVEKRDGIKFDYISPFNEPDGHWNWIGPKQEGTPATNREIARTVRLLNKEFVDRGINTRILVNESSDYRCMFNTHMTDWQRGYEIQSFFCPDSVETYIGNLSNVPRLLVGHSYWTNTPLDDLRNFRCRLRDTLNKYQVDFWQTETCIMSNDVEIGGGGGFDRTMKTALYVARIIHHDIVYAGACSWHWWRAIGGDYKDGLIREFSNADCLDGRVEDSKLMWALGNYSRFIRPGANRLAVTVYDRPGHAIADGDTDPWGLMCSAYKNKDGSLIFVVINYANEGKELAFDLDFPGWDKWQQYRTSDREGENLKPVGIVKRGKNVQVPARSIVTFVSANP